MEIPKIPKVFTHKKFQVGISTAVFLFFTNIVPSLEGSASLASALGTITVEQWLLIISPLLASIGAQGWADSGKEAAKINQGDKS